MVWLSQCIAFLRYYHWFHALKKKDILPGEFNRWDPQPDLYHWHKYRTVLASMRTIPAWCGLVGCFLIVFVFSSARFWNGQVTFTNFATAYAGVSLTILACSRSSTSANISRQPILLFGIYAILKIWKRRLWVRLELTSDALFKVTSEFEENSGLQLVELAPVEMVALND